MTRKDFEAIAKAIRSEADRWVVFSVEWKAVYDTATRLANLFESANPRFDRKIFMKACGF